MGSGVVLGVDYGSVRVGVAASDAAGVGARPVKTLAASGDLVASIGALAVDLDAVAVVVGLPTSLDGTEGESAAQARKLGAEIERETGLPVSYADERFTTKAADAALRGSTRDRRERREKVDAVAAAVMLQGWLDARAAARRGNPRYAPPLDPD